MKFSIGIHAHLLFLSGQYSFHWNYNRIKKCKTHNLFLFWKVKKKTNEEFTFHKNNTGIGLGLRIAGSWSRTTAKSTRHICWTSKHGLLKQSTTEDTRGLSRRTTLGTLTITQIPTTIIVHHQHENININDLVF